MLEQCITKTTHDVLRSITVLGLVCDGGIYAAGAGFCRDLKLVGTVSNNIIGVKHKGYRKGV